MRKRRFNPANPNEAAEQVKQYLATLGLTVDDLLDTACRERLTDDPVFYRMMKYFARLPVDPVQQAKAAQGR